MIQYNVEVSTTIYNFALSACEKTASGMLKHGLEELGKSCTVIEDAFDKAFEEHENSMAEDDR